MFKITEIIHTVKGIIETRVGLLKQDLQDEFVRILSRVVLMMVMVILLLLVFLFLSISLAFYLSQLTKTPYLGFLIVALIYFLAVLVMYLTKEPLNFHGRIELALKNFILNFKKKRIEEDNE
ncbi:phage holin family protein [Algoriphagus sp.]|uniref:phage holin family protein n=1 Tax=Algoriphagus sp. TaxID=1872435 RepID=UPI00391DD9B0